MEMLVSMTILAVMTTYATANFRSGQRSDELRIAINQTISVVRRVQTMAISGQTVPICAGGTRSGLLCKTYTNAECGSGGTCGRTVPRAYGIRFSTGATKNQVATVFADLETGNHNVFDNGEDLSTEELAPKGIVTVSAVSPNTGGNLDIVYEPPKPRVWINGSTNVASATVQLRHTITGLTKTLQVNSVSGRIGE